MSHRATDALRAEHAQLLPEIDGLVATGDAVGAVPLPQLWAQLDARLAFLVDQLVPHARAEDAVLYPLVDELLGAPEATATMRRDHEEIGRFIDELRAARRDGERGGSAALEQ